jgi:septum site-determining protein MinC
MGIKIKGKAGGVFEIDIPLLSSFVDIKKDIAVKLSKNKDFFTGAGARIIFSGKSLSLAQKQDLKRMLQMDYDISDVDFNEAMAQTEVDVRREEAEAVPSSQVELVSKDYFKAKSVFVVHTLRSGQRIECEGDVVVLGDVNDGAEVIAGGSIAVMGTLRGLVHAGATGRSDVVVAANTLQPKQLRISGKIAMFPDNRAADAPEVAAYKQGSIVVRLIKPQPARIR